jgi:hypothetical protein
MKIAELVALRRADCPKCDGGFICEQHPALSWPHDECPGPGMPCDAPGCVLERLKEMGLD